MVRKWISCVVILAFVMMTMSLSAHAIMPSHSPTTVTSTPKAAKHPGCHGHEAAQTKADSHSQKHTPAKHGCCDGKACKCLGGNCNAPAKVFGSQSFTLMAPALHAALLPQEQTIALYDHPSRIKRPPRL